MNYADLSPGGYPRLTRDEVAALAAVAAGHGSHLIVRGQVSRVILESPLLDSPRRRASDWCALDEWREALREALEWATWQQKTTD